MAKTSLVDVIDPHLYTGTGSPEGVQAAGIGSIFRRTNGGAGTTLYVKESGSGNTGWVAVSSGGGSPSFVSLAKWNIGA